MSDEEKRRLIGPNEAIPIVRQCELLGLPRSTYYYEPAGESPENLDLMNKIDELHTGKPFLGRRRLALMISRTGFLVNEKRIRRLMRLMGLETIYPKPRLSVLQDKARIYPYLLRDLAIVSPNQVWSTDITYIRLRHGFLYLVAIMDWHSRYVLSWELSNTLDTGFCLEALEKALDFGKPEIFNSDQGCQFTSQAFTKRLLDEDIRISMDGRGRAFDNIFVERLWRSLKYEEIYLNDYGSVLEATRGISRWFEFYNRERPHQKLGNRTPYEAFIKVPQAS